MSRQRRSFLAGLSTFVIACGGNALSTSVLPWQASSCSEGQSAWVDVNNSTGAYASIYGGGGMFIGSASPGRTSWRLPANSSYAYVGRETAEPYPKRHMADKPDV